MASQEINNCEFNTDLGMRYYGRPTTFCSDLFVGGNLIVAGSIEEGAPVDLGGGGGGSCFDQLKITKSFLVEGDACFKESINLEKDLKVRGILATEYAKVNKDCRVSGQVCIDKSVKVNQGLEVAEDVSVGGNLIVGEGSVLCNDPLLKQAKVVCDGTMLVTDTMHGPNLVLTEKVFSDESISNTVRTEKLVIGEFVYQEKEVEILVDGLPTLITVLVKGTAEQPPTTPPKVKSCPVSIPCVVVATPAPPCPSIDC